MGESEKGRVMGERIRSHRDLKVYQNARKAAMEIFELSKSFPPEEKFSLTDQGRRSSRSVGKAIIEAISLSPIHPLSPSILKTWNY